MKYRSAEAQRLSEPQSEYYRSRFDALMASGLRIRRLYWYRDTKDGAWQSDNARALPWNGTSATTGYFRISQISRGKWLPQRCWGSHAGITYEAQPSWEKARALCERAHKQEVLDFLVFTLPEDIPE